MHEEIEEKQPKKKFFVARADERIRGFTFHVLCYVMNDKNKEKQLLRTHFSYYSQIHESAWNKPAQKIYIEKINSGQSHIYRLNCAKKPIGLKPEAFCYRIFFCFLLCICKLKLN